MWQACPESLPYQQQDPDRPLTSGHLWIKEVVPLIGVRLLPASKADGFPISGNPIFIIPGLFLYLGNPQETAMQAVLL